DSEQVVEDEDSEQVVEDEDSEQVVEDEDSEQVVEDENLDLEETEESSNEEISDQDLLQATNNFKVETYNANSSISLAKQENKVEEPVVEKYAEKFVNVEFLNVREAASTDANIVTTIQAGDKVTGTIEGDWLNTDQGYIKLSYLQDSYPQTLVDKIKAKKAEAEKKAQEEAQKKAEAEKKAQEEAQKKAEAEKKAQEEAQKNKAVNYTGWVNTAGLNVRSNSSTNGSILGTLTKGDKVSGVLQNGWIKFNFNGREAFVKASYVVDYEVKKPAPAPTPVVEQKPQQQVNSIQQAPVVPTGNGQSAANIAQQFVGYPYVFGANNPSTGFDCSGLVYYAYSQLGVNLSRNSAAQFNNGYAVDINNLVPGDLVFFSYGGNIDHVGMITGYDGTFIHASTPGTGVIYGNVFSSNYQSVYRGARRIF
ncbi:MAG: C40 family peptidase, partial [Anaerococcus sp.]